ncbi:hypothetical protein ACFPVY_11730 [Flavobacterium qiangtangense]|uniref:Uncharacterized protein n=1 Tax=Flavobacterium qiangtangense TaxID=1442595 RepID=A0ABW1PP53_9FLAO
MYIKKEARGKRQGARVWEKEIIFLISSFFFSISSNAQCAMCRAVLETEEGGVKAEAVNDGILYLMVFPYILVGILGYVIYRMKTKKKPEN